MESIESDSTNSGLVNGLTDGNEGGIPSGGVGVVKRSKKSGQLRSSASSQGSSVRGELTLVRGSSETSTATTTSDEEEERRPIIKRRKKKTRKSQHHHHHSVIHHQPSSAPAAPAHDDDDDDDERTDSANEEHKDEDDDQRGGAYIQGPHPRAARGFKLSAGGIAPFDPTSSILKPLSPTMLNVGYGTELMVTHPQQQQPQQGDFSNVAALIGGSPHQSEGQASTGGIVGGVGLSPEQTDGISRANIIEHDSNPVMSLLPTTLAPLLPSTVSSLSVSNTGTPVGGAGGTPGGGTPVGGVGSILNPSSSSIPAAAANALPFAGWWGQHTAATAPPIYSPFCGPSGSVATTPVAGASDSLMRPGSSVLLRAVICQESEGVLIVNVQWRNKSYSGSLIDVSQHQWAPPRLMEGFQDLPVQLKDLYAKQESEKEPVDVVIDEEKEDVILEDSKPTATKQHSEEHVEETLPPRVINETIPADKGGQTISDGSDQPSSVTTTTGTNSNVAVTTSTSSSTSSASGTSTSSKTTNCDMLMKPPNGLKAPPSSSTVPDKLKPPTMPAFDAVKSPQPQIGRDDNDSNNRKKDHSMEGGVAIPDTHRNLNTLVDVAAKMKPVSNEAPPTSKKTNNGVKSLPTHHHQETSIDKTGSVIEQHQLKDSNKAPKEERPVPMSGGSIPHNKYPSPDDQALAAPSILHSTYTVSEGSISPEKQYHPPIGDGKEDRSNILSKKTNSGHPPPGKQIGHSWHPPVQESKDKRGSPTPSMPNALNSKPRGIIGEQHHLPPTLNFPGHPAVPPNAAPSSSVIHKPILQQKRKRLNNETSSKRPSPPLKERDNSPLGGGASMFARPFDHLSLIQQDKQMKPHEQQGPPGFQYDPSLPMNWEFQVMSYTREKEKQAEANRNTERSTPPTKPQKRSSHPPGPYEMGDHPPSSGSHSPTHFIPGGAKRSTSSTSNSNNSAGSKISPSVVVQPPDSRHLMLQRQSPPKQEMHPPTRPARPSSKGGGVPSSHVPPGKSSSRKGNPSRRPDNVVGGGPPMIKQEPPDHSIPQSHHVMPPPPGGGATHMPGYHPAAFILNPSSAGGNTPVAILQPPLTQSSPWMGGVISSNPSSSSQPHRRTPNDNLSLTRGGSTSVNRSPSPAPNKKSEWMPSHAPSIHQQTIKHESINNRHSNVTGDKHGNSSVSTHGSSSSSSSSSRSSSHHGNKHDSSSARHLIAGQSHPIPPPPSVPAGAQALSPSYNIADLRNGVSVDWMKHMQLMQIDALKQGGIVGHAPQIPAPVHPQELALWQNQMAQLAAMQTQLPVDQAAALQMQLALQQQQHQQQQQNEAVTQAALAQGFFPTLQFPATQVLPFPALAQPPKRDT